METVGKHVKERAAPATDVKGELLMVKSEAAFGTFPLADPVSKNFQACSIVASGTNKLLAVQVEL